MGIICNVCNEVIPNPEWKTIRDGEIEHTHFECPDCGKQPSTILTSSDHSVLMILRFGLL